MSHRTDKTRLFRLDTDSQSCDARNNIAYITQAPGSTLKVLDNYGVLTLTRNWFNSGWSPFNVNRPKGSITESGTITGSNPGFIDESAEDFHLALGSQCIDTGTALHPDVLPTFNVTLEYVKHLSSTPRPVHPPLDIGAYERP